MNEQRLQELLEQIRSARVLVFGDFCVDAYWTFDLSASESSIETGKQTWPVRLQRYGLGGAGNVVSNLAALGVGEVRAAAVVGDDVFGREMVSMLQRIGVHTEGVVVQRDRWDTPVYGKPHISDEEQNRIDFGLFNDITEATADRVAAALAEAADRVDAVILNQQLARGVTSPAMLARLNRIIAQRPERIFIVDSRDKSEAYERVILKLNGHEAARLCRDDIPVDQLVPRDDVERYARAIFPSTGKPVVITRGDRGCIVFDGQALTETPGVQILKKVDPVGAGDTFVSALSAALAAGATPAEAAELANFAAAVTVQKLQQTGVASPEEILAIGSSPDYVYRPEIAEDPRGQRHVPGTEIEIVNEHVELGRIRHAMFDHDGTVSALRQGWEEIMEPVMVKAILGPHYESADEAAYRRVVDRVLDYIDKSTGIQTIVQMEALVEMVKDFGFVPEAERLDKSGYKRIYNDALMALVNGRVEKLRRGELDVSDFTIKGAVGFAHQLHDRGVTLYVASGTDREDVLREAQALGYASLFGDRVYGAVGDLSQYSKKKVVDEIFRSHGLRGPELVCFGDGPVELRETKKRGGIAVGVASDEVRRYGLNRGKRARLVKAGADLIVPDFSQASALLAYLFGE